MEKIRLNVEQLRVESFQTEEPRDERGTVHALGVTIGGNCTATTCPPAKCFCTENLSCRCN